MLDAKTKEVKDKEEADAAAKKKEAEKLKVSADPEDTRTQKEKDTDEFKKMLEDANASLKDQKVGEIGLSHVYWGLMNAARKFANERGL